MGNASSSKDRHDDTVDFGALSPQGIYTGAQDWNQAVVAQAIVERKLAPFYRPLEDYEEDWDDERILAARKELPPPPPPPPPSANQPGNSASGFHSGLPHNSSSTSSAAADHHSTLLPHLHSTSSQISSRSNISSSHKSARASAKEPQRSLSEAKVYRGAVECPICFLYFPQNINRSRCCDQAICTECFVQIKRNEPTPTHLVSEPACCPYCVQPNFGVVYTPPPWRAGIGADSPIRPELLKVISSSSDSSGGPGGQARSRQKAANHASADIITIDQIRPDWEAKLNAVKAAVARRANRRIIMRQVGDRLIPIGVTSGRMLPIGDPNSNGSGDGDPSARRSRRRQNNPPPVTGELGQLLNSMGVVMGGQDLEDLLLQEAMRLSLLEHEAEQRRNQQAGQNNSENPTTPEPPQSGDGTPSNNPSQSSLALDRGREGGPIILSGSPSSRPRSASPTGGRTSTDNETRRRSHVPVAPSPLGSSAAGIAMAIGLPSPPNTANLSVPGDNDQRTPNGSRSHSRASSRSHSRQPSQTPSFTALAAAMSATNTAMAFIPPDSDSGPRGQNPSSNSTSTPSGPDSSARVSSLDSEDSIQPPESSRDAVKPYHVLPSTPDLDASEPLIAEDTKASQSQTSVPSTAGGGARTN